MSFSLLPSKIVEPPNKVSNLKKKCKDSQIKTKHFLKIIGHSIIRFLFQKDQFELIQSFLNKINPFFNEKYEQEAKDAKFHVQDFHVWIKSEELNSKFLNLKTIREIWGYKLEIFDSLSFKHRFFCCVLKRISKYFLHKEFIAALFNKVGKGITKLENAQHYLREMPRLMRLVKNPEDFF